MPKKQAQKQPKRALAVRLSEKAFASKDEYGEVFKLEGDTAIVEHVFTVTIPQVLGQLQAQPTASPIDNEDNDFGAFSCQFRKVKNSASYSCFSRNPLVRILADGSVPKDICRLCERWLREIELLNKAMVTNSGRVYQELLRKKRREEREAERLAYLKKRENIKTEGLKERKALQQSGTSSRRAKVDWGDSEGYDPFMLGNQ